MYDICLSFFTMMHKMGIHEKLRIYINYEFPYIIKCFDRIGASIMTWFGDYKFELIVFPTLGGEK